MKRTLFHWATALSLLLLLATLALWTRSKFVGDHVGWATGSSVVTMTSERFSGYSFLYLNVRARAVTSRSVLIHYWSSAPAAGSRMASGPPRPTQRYFFALVINFVYDPSPPDSPIAGGIVRGGRTYRIVLLDGVTAGMTAILPLWWLLTRNRSRQRYRLRHGLCVGCGYSLAGNVSGICPECGRPTVNAATSPPGVRARACMMLAVPGFFGALKLLGAQVSDDLGDHLLAAVLLYPSLALMLGAVVGPKRIAHWLVGNVITVYGCFFGAAMIVLAIIGANEERGGIRWLGVAMMGVFSLGSFFVAWVCSSAHPDGGQGFDRLMRPMSRIFDTPRPRTTLEGNEPMTEKERQD